MFLGVSDLSDELCVGTERGMHKVRKVRRREATERVDLTLATSERTQEGERRASCVA